MLGETIASVAGSALVTAMVGDAWESVRGRFARLLGRGNGGTKAAEERLDKSRAALAGVSGADLERAKAEQEIAWRTRLADFLEQEPGAEPELRTLVAEIQVLATNSAPHIDQRAAAFDHAQQAVLGQGVQHATFGGQDGPAHP
jgi:hypothetical protein